MGRPYDHQYHFAGSGSSSGTMICPACHKGINPKADDWREYKRDKHGDWGFVTHHRSCCPDDPMWARIEADRDAAKARAAKLLIAAKEFRDQWGVDDLDELIEDLTIGHDNER